MIEGPITDNIEALLQEISSKRLKGQWGRVLKACEKLARLCDMGLRQQDMVDKKLRVAYWTAMAETKLEMSGETARAMECLKEATKSEVTGDSVEWVEWRIILAKCLLTAKVSISEGIAANESRGTSRDRNSVGRSGGESHKNVIRSPGRGVPVGAEEEMKPEEIFNNKMTEDLKMPPHQIRMIFKSLSCSDTIKKSTIYRLSQQILATLHLMDDESRFVVLKDVLAWMNKHRYTEMPSSPSMQTKALSVWTYITARRLLDKVRIEQLVERILARNGRDYTAWLQLDAIIAHATLSIELEEYVHARDKLRLFLSTLFPDETMQVGLFSSMIRTSIIDALARLPIIEVELGDPSAALEAYRRCISGSSSVRAHLPAPTQVGMLFSAVLLLLAEEENREQYEASDGSSDKAVSPPSLSSSSSSGETSGLDSAYSLLQSIGHIMTASAVQIDRPDAKKKGRTTEALSLEPLLQPPGAGETSGSSETGVDHADPPSMPPPPPSQSPPPPPPPPPSSSSQRQQEEVGDDRSMLARDEASNANDVVPEPVRDGGSLHPIAAPAHSLLTRLPISPLSPVVEAEFVTPGRFGVILWVLMKKMQRGLGLDMLEWSSSHEILPDSDLLWLLGCAYRAGREWSSSVALLVQCHDVCTRMNEGLAKLDRRREVEFKRIVTWLDPKPRPEQEPWLPILLASYTAHTCLADADQALTLASRGIKELFPTQGEYISDMCDKLVTAKLASARVGCTLTRMQEEVRAAVMGVHSVLGSDKEEKETATILLDPAPFSDSAFSSVPGQQTAELQAFGFRQIALVVAQVLASKSRTRGVLSTVRLCYRKAAMALLVQLRAHMGRTDATIQLSVEPGTFAEVLLLEYALLLVESGDVQEAQAMVSQGLTLNRNNRKLQHLDVLLATTGQPLELKDALAKAKDYISSSSSSSSSSRHKADLPCRRLRLTLAHILLGMGKAEEATRIAEEVLEQTEVTAEALQKASIGHPTACNEDETGKMEALARCMTECAALLRSTQAPRSIELARRAVLGAWAILTRAMPPAAPPNNPSATQSVDEKRLAEVMRHLPQANGWRLPLNMGWGHFDTQPNDALAGVLAEYAAVVTSHDAFPAAERLAFSADVFAIALTICPTHVSSLIGQAMCLLEGASAETPIAPSARRDRLSLAHGLATRAVNVQDEDPACWNAVGRCQEALGDTEAALISFNLVLRKAEVGNIRGDWRLA